MYALDCKRMVLPQVECLGYYWPKGHPYRDLFSAMLLRFKLGCSFEYNYFKNLAAQWFNENIKEPTLIVTVPSSKKGKQNSISKLIKELCKENNLMIDGTDIIVKKYSTGSACLGFKRGNSFASSFELSRSVKGCKILVVDDVCSSGKTFSVITEMLYQKCVWVDYFAFGKNINDLL